MGHGVPKRCRCDKQVAILMSTWPQPWWEKHHEYPDGLSTQSTAYAEFSCCWSEEAADKIVEFSVIWGIMMLMCHHIYDQATGLDAWASRVKCPARFVSHLHEICIYIWVVYSLCFFCCLFITVTWWYVWCIEWASGDQEEVQGCLVTLWLFIISCYSLYKTTTNPHFHKYSMDFHV